MHWQFEIPLGIYALEIISRVDAGNLPGARYGMVSRAKNTVTTVILAAALLSCLERFNLQHEDEFNAALGPDQAQGSTLRRRNPRLTLAMLRKPQRSRGGNELGADEANHLGGS